MLSSLNIFLHFRNNAREAMEFYKTVFGGQLEMQTFKDCHITQDPREDYKIMYAMLTVNNGIIITAADTLNNMEYITGTNISLFLSGDNIAELTAYYEKLSVGGTVRMLLGKAVWGDTFGMVTDKFGVSWIMNISRQKG